MYFLLYHCLPSLSCVLGLLLLHTHFCHWLLCGWPTLNMWRLQSPPSAARTKRTPRTLRPGAVPALSQHRAHSRDSPTCHTVLLALLTDVAAPSLSVQPDPDSHTLQPAAASPLSVSAHQAPTKHMHMSRGRLLFRRPPLRARTLLCVMA